MLSNGQLGVAPIQYIPEIAEKVKNSSTLSMRRTADGLFPRN